MSHWNPVQVGLWILMAAAVAVTIFVSVGVAVAEDESARTLLEKLAAGQKKNDEGALVTAVRQAAQIHNDCKAKPLRAKIVAAVGKVAKNKKAGMARIPAIEALGQIDDTAAAFKHLKPLFPSPKTKPEDAVPRTVIEAAGKLGVDAAIPLLAGIAKKSKATPLRRAAVEALGGYGSSSRRADAAKALLEALADWKKASTKKTKKAAAQAAAAVPWEMLGPVAAEALRQLTGATHESPDDWLEALAAAKGKVASLFPEEAG